MRLVPLFEDTDNSWIVNDDYGTVTIKDKQYSRLCKWQGVEYLIISVKPTGEKADLKKLGGKPFTANVSELNLKEIKPKNESKSPAPETLETRLKGLIKITDSYDKGSAYSKLSALKPGDEFNYEGNLATIKKMDTNELLAVWHGWRGDRVLHIYKKDANIVMGKLLSNTKIDKNGNLTDNKPVKEEKDYKLPIHTKLSQEKFNELVGLVKTNSIDDLIEKGHKKSDVLYANDCAMKEIGGNAKDGDRKGDDDSSKQYFDRTIKK